jgi:hypothetical protein
VAFVIRFSVFRLASVFALVLFAAVSVAQAGQSSFHMSGKRTGYSGKHGAYHLSVKKKFSHRSVQTQHRFLATQHAGIHSLRPGGKHARFRHGDFIRLAPAAKILHGPGHRYRHGDGFRGSGRSGDQIAIVIGAGANEAAAAPEPGGVVLEGGSCEAGAYCTIRLGAGSSAPKIITLNTSGALIPCLGKDCTPVN